MTDIQFLLNTAAYSAPVYCGPNWLAQVDPLIARGLLTVTFDYRSGQGADAERVKSYQPHDAVSVRVSDKGVEACVEWLTSNGQEQRAQDLAAKTDPHRAERAQAATQVAATLRQGMPRA